MQFKKRQHKNVRLDITPLIDVVFLLLIFFMISTTFVTNPGIKIQLPLAKSKSQPDNKPIEIVITKENRLFLNGRSINSNELYSAISREIKKGDNKPLVLKADGRVQHRMVVSILDIAKQSGVKRLSIATEPKQK